MKPKVIFLIPIFLFPALVQSQDKTIQIDGIDIKYETVGMESREEGQPVVIFENGLATPKGIWHKILESDSELPPMFAYNRSGVADSELKIEEPTPKIVCNRLVNILEKLNIPPPYILVGHSFGGLYARYFAEYYPEKLAGLILVDPADFTETREDKREYYKVLGWDKERIDQEIRTQDSIRANRKVDPNSAAYWEGQVLDKERMNDFRNIRNNPLPDIPFHIITGGRFDMPERMRSKEFDEETVFRNKMKLRTARWMELVQTVDKGKFLYSSNSGHNVMLDDPELIISSIKMILLDLDD